MKVLDEGDNEQARMPSRAQVDEAVNPRTRNDEIDGDIPRNRTPFGVGRLRLGVTNIPGYHLHWIANYPGRLEDAEANGYEFVTRAEVKLSKGLGADSVDAGEYVSRISPGAHENGQPFVLHLMKLRNEWYEENQQFYQSRCNAVDAQMRAGKINGKRQPEMYHPKGGRISIDTKLE